MKHSRLIQSLITIFASAAIALVFGYALDFGQSLSLALSDGSTARAPWDQYNGLAVTFRESGWIWPPLRTPVIPFLNLLLYLPFDNWKLLPLAHTATFILSIVAIFWLFYRKISPIFAVVWTAGIYAYLYKPTILFPMSEAFATVFLIWMLACSCLWFAKKDVKWGYGASIFLMLLIMSKGVFAYLTLLFALMLAQWLIWEGFIKKDWRQRYKKMLLHAIAMAAIIWIPILGWMNFNLNRGGTFSLSNYSWFSAAGNVTSMMSRDLQVPADQDPDTPLVNEGLAMIAKHLTTGFDPKIYFPLVDLDFEDIFYPVGYKPGDPSRGSQNCKSNEDFPFCVEGDLNQYVFFNHGINYYLHRLITPAAVIVSGKIGGGTKTWRVTEKISKAIVKDVSANYPEIYKKLIRMNLRGALLGDAVSENYYQNKYIVLLLFGAAGLAAVISLLMNPFKLPIVVNLIFWCGALHVGHMVMVAVWGGPIERYVMLTRPYFDQGILLIPLAVGWVLYGAWNKRLRKLRA